MQTLARHCIWAGLAMLAALAAACGGGSGGSSDTGTEIGDEIAVQADAGDDAAAVDADASADIVAAPELVEVGAEIAETVDELAPDTVPDVEPEELPEVSPGCPPGLSCDDGDPCTEGDTCTEDLGCKGTPKDCMDDVPCSIDQCDSDSGECIHVFANGCCEEDLDCIPPAPGPCDQWTCLAEDHQCQFQPLQGCCLLDTDCDDANKCTQDFCDAQGTCHNDAVAAACDDGDPCTVGDLCAQGTCEPGMEVLPCDDGNQCTQDVCTFGIGCTTIEAEGPCDDLNACTEGDSCKGGECVSGPNECGCKTDEECAEMGGDDDLCNGTLFCNKKNVPATCDIDPKTVVDCYAQGLPPDCHKFQCVPETGKCVAVPLQNGVPCDDWNPCTGGDACSTGTCSGVVMKGCGIGTPCVLPSDCSPGLTCFDAMPGGYCTKLGCDQVGCPEGTVCHVLQNGLAVCLLACESNADCRDAQGYACIQDGGCWCGPDICEALQMACNGDVAAMCNSCGSAFEPGGTDCAAEGLVCKAGECVPCEPDCTGKECGPDGCGGSCGTCGEGFVCNETAGLCACDCPQAPAPVCSVDHVTYDTFCQMQCALKKPDCTSEAACPDLFLPAACTEQCMVKPGDPVQVGQELLPFLCEDLNDQSATYKTPVSSYALKTMVWIAYFGSCGG